MADVSRLTTEQALNVLRSNTGLVQSVAALAQTRVEAVAFGPSQIIAQNAAAEVLERTDAAEYPAVYVYCEKITNLLREKFRTFSGESHMVIETRVSSESLEGLHRELQLYASAVTQVLDQSRGSWGNGMYYTGGYEVTYGSARRGGKNYIQTAKATFEVQVSIS